MKKVVFFTLILISSVAMSQSLQGYKYLLIPNKFSFQKKSHEYNLNKLTQFMFNKYGFEAFIEGGATSVTENISGCDILRVNDVTTGSLTTKIKFEFIDCKGNIIYTSKEGKSFYKEYDKAYNDAIRKVFKGDTKIRLHQYSEFQAKQRSKKIAEKITTPTPEIALNASVKAESLAFELREKKYLFKPISKTMFEVFFNNQNIGTVTKKTNTSGYTIEAKELTGTGSFDDFGNFILIRKNPVNGLELKDTLIRTK